MRTDDERKKDYDDFRDFSAKIEKYAIWAGVVAVSAVGAFFLATGYCITNNDRNRELEDKKRVPDVQKIQERPPVQDTLKVF